MYVTVLLLVCNTVYATVQSLTQVSNLCAGDSEDALRFLQQQHLRDFTLVSSVYLDDPDFQTYRSRYSSAPLLALFLSFSGAVMTTCSMCLLALQYGCMWH